MDEKDFIDDWAETAETPQKESVKENEWQLPQLAVLIKDFEEKLDIYDQLENIKQ
jgi:hypothetical protein